MKATGIVRRIDDLGRVVIPKEIRRTLRIREGDPLEIFTDREGEIILKKYSPSENSPHLQNSMQRALPRRWAAWYASAIWIRSLRLQALAKRICRINISAGRWRSSWETEARSWPHLAIRSMLP